MDRAAPSPIPFFRPSVGAEEASAVAEAIASGWLTSGPKVKELEQTMARRLGARHAVALSSCTAALHLALLGLEAQPGEVILTSPYTFTAGAEVALHAGLLPVFSDIDPRTLNLDPQALRKTARLERRKGNRIAAILPTHLGGQPCDMEAIDTLATELGCAVIEDAAHALPASLAGTPIGTRRSSGQPLATCLSFYANKTMTTGEGGMLLTDDTDLAGRCRRLALHGIDRDSWSREHAVGSDAKPPWSYDVSELGWKANLNDMAAAMGLVQLGKLYAMTEGRRRVARRYDRAFRDHPALEIPARIPGTESAWHLYILRLTLPSSEDSESVEILRNRWANALARRGVGTSLHYRPLHLHTAYRQRFGLEPEDFPRALHESRRALSLPIYPDLREAEIKTVTDSVLTSLDELGLG